MKYLIEPCCAVRQVMQLRDAIGRDGTKEFSGYGDLSLTELLPAILTRYSETELLVAAPALPDQAAEVVARWMRQQWPRRDGRGKLDAIRHLTVISDLSEGKSPAASQWLKENPWGERLTLIDKKQDDTVILLPDFAVTGPVNMRYGNPFTATATTKPEKVKALWEKFARTAEPEKPAAPEPAEAPEKPETTAATEPRRRNGRKAKDATAEPAVSEDPSEDAR